MLRSLFNRLRNWFLNWFDEAPREQMRERLLVEVNRSLAHRCPCDLCGGEVVDGQVTEETVLCSNCIDRIGVNT